MNPEMVGARSDSPLNKVHPVMIAGVFIFIAPFIGNAFGMNLPGWFSGVGIAVILLGVGLTIMGETR